MKYGSICSGIESASVAWEPLGMSSVWFSEIEPFPSAVLNYHWPNVANLGDMNNLPLLVKSGLIEAPDILVGGTPCQAFSVAGRREGLADPRGQLTLKYVELLDEIDKQRQGNEAVAVWENVPGVLSDKTNAFGCFLGALAGEDCELYPSGKRWSNAGCVFGSKRSIAWRVLDAQYFGVAQRRRRVFVVASARNGFNPASVLFESEGLRRDIAPSRETKKEITRSVSGGVNVDYCEKIANCLQTTCDDYSRADGFNMVVIPIQNATRGKSQNGLGVGNETDPSYTLDIGSQHGVNVGLTVRKLTPVECERLQGFPDNHTLIPWRNKAIEDCPDGPRYKAIGNSKAVPVIRWVGEQILKELNK